MKNLFPLRDLPKIEEIEENEIIKEEEHLEPNSPHAMRALPSIPVHTEEKSIVRAEVQVFIPRF